MADVDLDLSGSDSDDPPLAVEIGQPAGVSASWFVAMLGDGLAVTWLAQQAQHSDCHGVLPQQAPAHNSQLSGLPNQRVRLQPPATSLCL